MRRCKKLIWGGKMKIGILSQLLFTHKGGLERFSARLASEMCRRGHDCIIFHLGGGNGTSQYPLPKEVRTYDLALTGVQSLKSARRALQNEDLDLLCNLFSAETALWVLPLCKGLGIPLLMSERCSPHEVETLLWNRVERIACLSIADAIHMQSVHYLYSLPDYLKKRTTIIPNPVPRAQALNFEKEVSCRKYILAVSRLEEIQKRLSLLIEAFGLLAENFSDWDCYICGNGSCYEFYTGMISKLKLDGRVKLKGIVHDVEKYYADAHLFCIPSAYEGFPNALLEAQSYGLPSVGFACCGGVNEIIISGVNGILAEEMTPESLARALAPLMKDVQLRHRMSNKSLNLLCRYDKKMIFDKWESLFTSVSKSKKNTLLDRECIEDSKMLAKVRAILARPHPFARVEDTSQNPRVAGLASALRAQLKK